MICVAASVHRSYFFPADRGTAFAYYSDFTHIVPFLPLIALVDAYGEHRYRVVYHSTELGMYGVRIYCDTQTLLETRDAQRWVLRVEPLKGVTPAASRAGLSATQAQGFFASESVFSEVDGRTRVDYRLKLSASLPVPLGLALVPISLLDQIAGSITERRIYQIADAFIERSIAEFRGSARPVAR